MVLTFQSLKKNGTFIAKPWSQWTNDECKMAKLDCTVQNIIASALDTNEFFRISKCKTAKDMWDTLKVAHGHNEPKETMTKSQARRKNKKSLNLCFMARKEDDSSSVSSSNSSNSQNYGQLLKPFNKHMKKPTDWLS